MPDSAGNRTETPRYRPGGDAALALADGRVFRGRSFGAAADGTGEAVFTTTMVGYQEVCTDPSFRGQIVCMTYPLIGNYGVNASDDESRRPWIAGLVVREACPEPSHHRSLGTIDGYLRRHGVPGIAGVDTRALTRHIRDVGDTRAVLVSSAEGIADEDLIERARLAPLPGEQDVVGEVADETVERIDGEGPHIVVVDCGVKRNIVRSLVARGARVTVVPYGTPYAVITALAPDGVVVSPGPGDPANLDPAVVAAVVRDGTPFFGICLGHQLLARSLGADTTKLKFGHRGGNHPVRDELSGRVTITSQNHGFEVDGASLPVDGAWRVSQINVNDGSVEGLEHRSLPAMSVQFHPESSPGPWDNHGLFDRFLAMVAEYTAAGAGTGRRR
ncbi:MAG: Carbamoyl-phosphate synthase small chain [uncultured Thermomicrobiales bacterium]|uniref:Carbamoyl phosphate synthase small chain n=1 Tax=uncultured Thermomicrobiales bacterium TaxID=1645740 RepID=A0A6J4UHQ0_9BACT|nr:MAG: Carbamoyl-phosphate synthase small chain [uncultured Thermomicrobiales bacterium]